jgi:peptide/nickel transport system substrate-binding protein
MNQVYPYLMNFVPGTGELKPDIAQHCEFSAPKVFTCTLKPDLKFANGNPLTSSDVKFSFDRENTINDPNGPQSLLANLDNVDAPDPLTVHFNLKLPNDQTFPQVLATNAGPIVDEQVFPADKLLDDNAIAKAEPFAGPFTMTTYSKNELIGLKANPDYQGVLGEPKTQLVGVKYYASSDNLKIDIENRAIDVAWRSLSPTDIEGLRRNPNLTVHDGPGGELRYLTFNLNTMPGATPEQKLAVRKAIASSVDREALARDVYKGTYEPAYSVVPQSVAGANEAFKKYGTKPDPVAAKKYLTDAGVPVPVPINLQYNPDHYGVSSSEEYAAIKGQLDSTGLFQVNLQSTEWVTYTAERVKDAYPVYQLGWFPDFPDADNYLTPFFLPDSFVNNHFDDAGITKLITEEATEPDPAKRMAIIDQIQTEMADNFISTLPLLTGKQLVVADKDIDGVVLDKSFKFEYAPLYKNGGSA